jgi:hypothetical protein
LLTKATHEASFFQSDTGTLKKVQGHAGGHPFAFSPAVAEMVSIDRYKTCAGATFKYAPKQRGKESVSHGACNFCSEDVIKKIVGKETSGSRLRERGYG